MRTTCVRCRCTMLAPRPGEPCRACLVEANRRLRQRQQATRNANAPAARPGTTAA